MAIQTVNLGATGTGAGGDAARTAFEKLNANFSNPAHAASKMVQTSPTDTTAGALMAVGAFGLGGRNNFTTASVDALESGFHIQQRRLSGGATPSVFMDGDYVLVMKNNYASGPAGTLSSALAYGTYTRRLWWLTSLGASLEELKSEIYTSRSILGTVSQLNGVPTGAIIERGSNASGEYVRFADGTQICTRALSVPLNGAAGFVTGSYPAAFVGPPSGGWTAEVPAGSNIPALRGCFATTASTYWAFRHEGGGNSSVMVYLIAIGRWY